MAKTRSDWQLVDSITPFLLFPSLTGRTSTASDLFPVLPEMCEEWLITEADKPRLTLSEPSRWADENDLLSRLLTSIVPRKLADKECLSLAVDFLQLVGKFALLGNRVEYRGAPFIQFP